MRDKASLGRRAATASASASASFDLRAAPSSPTSVVCLLQGKLLLSPAEKLLKGPGIDLLLGADDSNPPRLSFLPDLGKAVNPTLSAFSGVLVGNICWGVGGRRTTLKSQSPRGLGLDCVPEPGPRLSISSAHLEKNYHEPTLGWVPGSLRGKG